VLKEKPTHLCVGVYGARHIKTNPIHYYTKRNKKRYYFSITGIKNYRKFNTEIGFTSTKKSKSLKMLIKKVENSSTFRLEKGAAKILAMKLLKENGQLTTSEIIKEIRIAEPHIQWNENTIRKHLKSLERRNKVLKTRKNRHYLWRLNEYS